jgi:hypothetical protein
LPPTTILIIIFPSFLSFHCQPNPPESLNELNWQQKPEVKIFQITTPFFSPLIGFSPLIKGENFQIWELASK